MNLTQDKEKYASHHLELLYINYNNMISFDLTGIEANVSYLVYCKFYLM